MEDFVPTKIQMLSMEMQAKVVEVAYLSINGKLAPIHTKIQVKWVPPPINWFKLNSDDSSMGNPSLAIGGGIIRNENGG